MMGIVKLKCPKCDSVDILSITTAVDILRYYDNYRLVKTKIDHSSYGAPIAYRCLNEKCFAYWF